MTYKNADYAKAQDAAYQTVIDSGLTTLPIKLNKIIDHYPDLRIQKYSTWANKRGITHREACKLLNSDEGALWVSNSKSLILYNEKRSSKGRIRFTIAHELGHYILKHNQASERTLISRYALNGDEYDKFEREANYFAKRLLAPIPLVDLYTQHWNVIKANLVRDLFDVSGELSRRIIEDIKKRFHNTKGVIGEVHSIQWPFRNFVSHQANKVFCQNCSNMSTNSSANYCNICGSDRLIECNAHNYCDFKRTEKAIMRYKKIAVNDYGRANVCPKCDNEEIEDYEDVCMICGTYVRNICSGIHAEFDSTQGQMTPDDIDGCEINLKGNARYCTQCGAMSTFYYYDILRHWGEEHKAAQEDKLPFEL